MYSYIGNKVVTILLILKNGLKSLSKQKGNSTKRKLVTGSKQGFDYPYSTYMANVDNQNSLSSSCKSSELC